MKRVRSACIFQTLVFSQKPEAGYSREEALSVNRKEAEHYKSEIERTKTGYRITDMLEEGDGSVVIRIRKQYNDKADISEYF